MEQKKKDPIEQLETRLAGLRPVEPRDPERHAAGRAAFLQQARELKAGMAVSAGRATKLEENSFGQPVSDGDKGRQIGWNNVIQTLRAMWQPNRLTKKEHSIMFTPIATILIVLTLLFGGAGATAYAAQDSLPADALYPVKTLTEDLRMSLSTAEQSRLDLALGFAERRVGEMEALTGLGLTLDAGLVSRLGEEVEQALRLAAALPEGARQDALNRIIAQVGAMMGALEQMGAGADQPLLTQARVMLREQLRLAELGLNDPSTLQTRLRERQQTRAWEVKNDSPADDNGNGTGGNGNGDGNGNGNANDNGANANDNGDNANSNSDDGNGNGDNANGNGNDDNANGNGDDSNGNDDNSNGNGDDSNGNGGHDGNDNGGPNGNDNGNDDDANDNGGHGGGDNGNDGSGGDDRGGDDNGNDGSGGDDNGNDGDSGGDDRGGNDNDGGSSGDDHGGNGNDGGSGGDDRGGNDNDGGSGGDDSGGHGGDDKGGRGSSSVTSLPALIAVVLGLINAV